MKNKSKKMMLFSLVVMLGFSFVSLIVAFSIKNIPENISYVYVNKKWKSVPGMIAMKG